MLLKFVLFVLIPYAILLSVLLARKAPQRKTTKPISRGWGNRLRILIIGATGGSGRELVRQALEQGHQVTALVRKQKKMKIEDPNLRIMKRQCPRLRIARGSNARTKRGPLRARAQTIFLSEPGSFEGHGKHSSRDENV